MQTSTVPRVPLRRPPTEFQLYLRVAIFGAIVFGLTYGYIYFLKTPGTLNKGVADTAVILMGLSMILSGVCYFFNFFDTKIVYRKQLGLIGFAFGMAHVLLSWDAFTSLLNAENWAKGAIWPAFTGLLAFIIFTIMALVSNMRVARALGGKLWRYILRTGYLALILLKSARWITWYQGGMKTLPAMSLITSVFILIVILMRIALWWSLSRKKEA
jgi:DMSO/TMAO reductase YedYZ heme-binding membrane subunit